MVVLPVPPFWERTAIVGRGGEDRAHWGVDGGAKAQYAHRNLRKKRISRASAPDYNAPPQMNPSRARSKKARNPGG